MWPFTRKIPTPAPVVTPPEDDDEDDAPIRGTSGLESFQRRADTRAYELPQPKGAPNVAMDSAAYGLPSKLGFARYVIPDAQYDWFVSQTYLGPNVNAQIAQHWLVDKACSMPARDAIRQGFEIKADTPEIIEKLKEMDKQFRLDRQMREMIHFGRVFGQRIVLFRVLHTDPEYYSKPFNIDAVSPGMYMGMSQIDAQWIMPEITGNVIDDPASPAYYEPEYWRVGDLTIHRSHLHVYTPYPVPDVLKPRYNYGGVSVPQRIYERVYAAERTANEAPQLAMTKRLNILKIGGSVMGKITDLATKLLEWVNLRDNYGVYVAGPNDTIEQQETSLTDLDAVIMTQYQIVAAAANVPATKLMGTTPKGFNASGEYEEAVYREELESIQTNDLQPLIERHHQLCMKSAGLPGKSIVTFEPLDSPTASEWATINKTKADTDAVYINAGVLTQEDVRERLADDKNSDYHGLEDTAPDDLLSDLLEPDETDTDTPSLGASA